MLLYLLLNIEKLYQIFDVFYSALFFHSTCADVLNVKALSGYPSTGMEYIMYILYNIISLTYQCVVSFRYIQSILFNQFSFISLMRSTFELKHCSNFQVSFYMIHNILSLYSNFRYTQSAFVLIFMCMII